jgi:alpha-D-ribose 1-methylphosphonate 5-triphosphate synthase subunit PhnG
MTVTREISKQAQRKAAMTVLAHSDAAGIASRLDALALPDHEVLREPENGLVMVRGRIGGDGAPFNLGEPRSRARRYGCRPAKSALATRSAAIGRRRG